METLTNAMGRDTGTGRTRAPNKVRRAVSNSILFEHVSQSGLRQFYLSMSCKASPRFRRCTHSEIIRHLFFNKAKLLLTKTDVVLILAISLIPKK